MLARDGGLMERVSFRHCTADATLKMVQVYNVDFPGLIDYIDS